MNRAPSLNVSLLPRVAGEGGAYAPDEGGCHSTFSKPGLLSSDRLPETLLSVRQVRLESVKMPSRKKSARRLPAPRQTANEVIAARFVGQTVFVCEHIVSRKRPIRDAVKAEPLEEHHSGWQLLCGEDTDADLERESIRWAVEYACEFDSSLIGVLLPFEDSEVLEFVREKPGDVWCLRVEERGKPALLPVSELHQMMRGDR